MTNEELRHMTNQQKMKLDQLEKTLKSIGPDIMKYKIAIIQASELYGYGKIDYQNDIDHGTLTMGVNKPPPPLRTEYDHSWQNPESFDYDPLRVIKETPDMREGRLIRPRPPPPPPNRYIRGY